MVTTQKSKSTLSSDLIAGLTASIPSIPDAMASGVLAGINPIGAKLVNYQGEQLMPALVTIALVIGIVQLLAGLLRLGFLIRFVSNAVMTGFLSGLGVLIPAPARH